MRKLSQEDFLKRSLNKHGDIYDYSWAIYTGCDVPLKIVCKIHGLFEQTPWDHWSGHGCRDCANSIQGVDSPLWKGIGELSATYWNSVKRNARVRELEFKITKEYAWNLFLRQERRCVYTNEILLMVKSNFTASLDRLDNTVGYLPENVQWVHKDVNLMKMNLSDERFSELCRKISNRIKPDLSFFKIMPHAIAPKWGTQQAACFDLAACLLDTETVTYYTPQNEKLQQSVKDGVVTILPGERMMIPTGLIFDIKKGFSIRIHSRSGMAVKNGLVLANHEGVIDSDYVDPTYLVMHNVSSVMQSINHGDRLAQGELVPDIAYEVLETTERPKPKTERAGGFGSTGQ